MRVLIAHANETSRNKLVDVVTRGRRIPLDIVSLGDGPEVLELLLADDPPEVALVDWDLPGIEAPEMCRLVREFHQHHDTWLVVLTPPAHRESAGEVWKAGADDCVFTPATAKLLSERVTKGLCEMAPPMREIAAAVETAAAAPAAAATAAAAQPAPAPASRAPARATLQALSSAGAQLASHVTEDSAGPEPTTGSRPTLDAISRSDMDVPEEEPADLSADLRATVDAEDVHEAAELAGTPSQLAAQSIDMDGPDHTPHGGVTLDAVLARL